MIKKDFIQRYRGKYPSDFLIAVYFVLDKEGGFRRDCGLVDDPKDRGGLTKFGISKRAFPGLDIRNLTLDRAVSIYFRNYWRPNKTSELPPGLSIVVFDSAVQHGVRTAARLLQEILTVSADGIVGRQTIAAANNDDVKFSIAKFTLRRSRFYARIIKRNPSQVRFIEGWHNRLDKLLSMSFGVAGVY